MISAHHAQLILGLISNLETRSAFHEIFKLYKKKTQDAKQAQKSEDAKDGQNEAPTPESPSKFGPGDGLGDEYPGSGYGEPGAGLNYRKKRRFTLVENSKKTKVSKGICIVSTNV